MTPATTLHPRLRRTLIAITATAALALTGCGSEEPSNSSSSTDSTPTASAEAPSSSASPSESKPKRSKETKAPESVDEVVVDVTVTGDEVTPVAQSVELAVGETLLLEVNSDRAGELHVHSSPEQFADFAAGASQLDFTFDKPGSVDIEEHDSGALVVRVLVQ